MQTNIKWVTGLLIMLCMFLIVGNTNATVTSKSSEKSERFIKKANKQQGKIHKKIHKIQNRITKAKEKAGTPVLDDAGFLEGTDDRVRWGLVGVVGGLLLGIILVAALKWIGWLALVAGLGLLIWYLIDP